MDGNICRLCLKTIFGNFQIIDDALKNTLDVLLFKLNLNIPKKSIICNECLNNLQLLHNFKSACINMKDRNLPLTDLKNDAGMDLEKIGNMYNMKSSVESKDQMICCFCTKTIGREGLISLNESKENTFVVDMLKEHIPELKSNMIELLTCETCLVSVKCLLRFHMNILNEEEKIRDNAEIERAHIKEEIKLQDVQQFTIKPELKYDHECYDVNEAGERCYENQERFTIETKAEIKCENETDNPELLIKTEDVDIKSEQNDGDSFIGVSSELMDHDKMCLSQHEVGSVKDCKINHEKQQVTQVRARRHGSSILTREKQSDIMYKCEMCTYETKLKKSHRLHILCHKNPSDVTMYKCEMCTFETKRKNYLTMHMLCHKDRSEITMYKCEMCTYESKHKKGLSQHMLNHKSPAETTIYKCATCLFETKYKSTLYKHMLNHKNPSETTMYKCEECTYETKHNVHLKNHMLVHKNPSDITMYKCEICTRELKHKRSLQRHMLIHSDSTLYKCEICTFVTKDKSILDLHTLAHTEIYKCEMCTYETKKKRLLQLHITCHKEPSEVKMYKCDICTYESKRNAYLKLHMLTHKHPSELTMFKCEMCTFETKVKGRLTRHMSTHNSPSKIMMHKCEVCTYETKHKSCLSRHMVTHKNPSNVTLYKCEFCACLTKQKRYLKVHMLTHKNEAKRTL